MSLCLLGLVLVLILLRLPFVAVWVGVEKGVPVTATVLVGTEDKVSDLDGAGGLGTTAFSWGIKTTFCGGDIAYLTRPAMSLILQSTRC